MVRRVLVGDRFPGSESLSWGDACGAGCPLSVGPLFVAGWREGWCVVAELFEGRGWCIRGMFPSPALALGYVAGCWEAEDRANVVIIEAGRGNMMQRAASE